MHLMIDDIMYTLCEHCNVKFASWQNIYPCLSII